MESNELQELEQMREQYEELKGRFDQQKIINDDLLLNSMKSKVGEIRRIIMFDVILAVIIIVTAPFVFHYNPVIRASWAFVAATIVLMLTCLFFDMKCKKELDNPSLAGCDMLSYSKSAAKIKQDFRNWLKYAFFMLIPWVIWLSAEILVHSDDKKTALLFIVSLIIGCALGGICGYSLDRRVMRICDDIVSQIEQ